MNSSDALAAKRYAKAYALSGKSGDAAALYAALNTAYESVKNVEALFSPAVSKNKKKDFVSSVFGGDKKIISFFNLLIENKRLNLLGAIVKETKKIVNKQLNKAEVKITTAYAPDAAEKEKIKKAVSLLLGVKTVDAYFETRVNIIGGLIIKTDDMTADASVSGGLERLRETC